MKYLMIIIWFQANTSFINETTTRRIEYNDQAACEHAIEKGIFQKGNDGLTGMAVYCVPKPLGEW